MRNLRPPLLLLLALSCLACRADDDDGRPAPPTGEGRPAAALGLSPRQQDLSGLKTQPLQAAALGREARAYGRVVDISPLLDLRARHRGAQSELAIAQAALQVAQKNRDRLAKLHAESIIPARDLIQAEAQLAADLARHDAALRHVREVREEALQSFGEALFKQAAEAESALFEGLLKHSQVLALIALPPGQSLPKTARSISIAPSGEPGKARAAALVSAAPRTEESTQGETWFFAADAAGLRTGMRLDALVPQAGAAAPGVLIPLSAVVWRDGQPWAFVKTGPGQFARRAVAGRRPRGGDWFVEEGFKPGEEVVTVGAQMLLSEEQRRAGPQDDDD